MGHLIVRRNRKLHPAPRHLDAPVKIWNFTATQWALILATLAATWFIAHLIPPVVPTTWKMMALCTLAGFPLAIALSYDERTGSLSQAPRRLLESLRTPRRLGSGPPTRGPEAWITIAKPDTSEEED